jgi:hypothetical protein
MALYNLARVTTTTTGTGTITLNGAVDGFLTFAQAGVSTGETVSYSIRDGDNTEVGRGVYTSSGTTLTRSVLKSTNANAAISLTGGAEVFISALAEDFTNLQIGVNVKSYGATGDGSTDDTAAIQAAIDSFGSGGVLATANGGTLYFPPGLYKITGGLLIQQTGVRIVGASQDATKIVVAGNLGTEAVFEWDQTNSGYSQVGCGIENLRINLAGYTGHGVWMHKAYDGVTLTNVYVDNVHDAYNGFRFEEDSGVTDQISQTITLTNCCAIHQNATADEPLFYFQNVQEALLQSCKAFGTYEANGKATCYPFEFIDCRGIVMTKCSAAFADRHGIYIRTSTRVSSGITIIGPTFETIDGAILVSGGTNGEVSNLRVINPRTEGTVANAAGAIDLNKVYRSHLETNSLTVNLDASCQRVVIESDDDTQVTDAGTQTTVIGFANGIHNNYRVTPAIYSNNVIASNTGLKALDTDASNVLAFKPGSNLSADRTLTMYTGDKDRAFDFSAGVAVNQLINGCMRFNQRGASSNADNTYGMDRWKILTQTGTVAVSQVTDQEDGTPHVMRITQSQASAQRFGVLQIIEGASTRHNRGQPVTLSARVRCSNSTTLRYAIIEWTGTANSVTSDFVNDWTSSTFTAGNFFTSTSTTITATGSTALTANTFTDISLTGTVGSSVLNLVVFFWTDSTQAQNSTLDIGRAQLESGSAATPFERRPYAFENAAVLRFYQKLLGDSNIGSWQSTSAALMLAGLPTAMRTTPTASLASGSTITVDCFGVGSSTSTTYFLTPTTTACKINVNTLSPTRTAAFPATSSTDIVLDAEL